MSADLVNDKNRIEEGLLAHLADVGSIADSIDFASNSGFDHSVVVAVTQSLLTAYMVEFTHKQTQFWMLTDEGVKYAQVGTPEFQVLRQAVSQNGNFEELRLQCSATMGADVAQLGLAQAMKRKLLSKSKDGSITILIQDASPSADVLQVALLAVRQGESSNVDEKIFKELKDRKMIKQETRKAISIVQGPKFARIREKPATDMTVDLLRSGDWATKSFKDYNFQAKGRLPDWGSLHPLLKVRTQLRNILLEMGFEEMPTNKWVESSFWNFDALFQPQQHPARDSHDTFFLSTAQETQTLPEDYVERVREMHQHGGDGSIGWRYNWSLDEAKKNLLRTHTTAVSSRMLYALAQQETFTPKKYFSIDRVFRNESIDATHLAEFHQIEGVVADRNLSLCDLIGVITAFFHRLGITNIKFKPAYNPYTEPSMEIFGFSPELKRWIEIGNSGMFRPEMLKPMGLPDDVRVIAWGLSLERPTMIKYGIGNIRDLFGHKVDLNMVRQNPVAFFK
jgi:phenylalanyl-tRNA synthetase alpha chain